MLTPFDFLLPDFLDILKVLLRNMCDGFKDVLHADFLHVEVQILRLLRSPLKHSAVLSAINIAVLNFRMSDEGIEADPDESMNE